MLEAGLERLAAQHRLSSLPASQPLGPLRVQHQGALQTQTRAQQQQPTGAQFSPYSQETGSRMGTSAGRGQGQGPPRASAGARPNSWYNLFGLPPSGAAAGVSSGVGATGRRSVGGGYAPSAFAAALAHR